MRVLIQSSLLLLFCLFVLARPGWANTTICVTAGSGGPAQLDNALRYWMQATDETVYIHLEQGSYDMLASGPNFSAPYFFYDQSGLFSDEESAANLTTGNASLHLVGGFVPGTNPSCSKRQLDASNTIISGKNGGGNARLWIYQSEGETLIDGVTFTKFGNGVQVQSHSDSSMTVRNVILSGNGNGDLNWPALFLRDDAIYGGVTHIRVENCLVVDNNTNGVQIEDDHSGDVSQVLGCTIANNAGYGLSVGDPFNSYFILNGALTTLNTIFRHNTLADVFVQGGGNKPTIAYSNVASISGGGQANTSNNQNADPVFVNEAGGEYQLQTNSPFVNQGAPESLASGGYAGTDIRGRERIIGTRVDFGPYETLVDNTTAQTVAITADTSTGSTLRAAILAANSSANPTTINFDISGGCPQYIDLTSLLPNITTDITIDGYSQPGAAPNDVVPGYDGNICIVLRGGGYDHGLQTSGAGRLTVRGIEFEDFSGAAIRLSSGSGHVVTGNGFAAFAGTGYANKVGVLIESTATASQIGSYAFGDRNVFGNGTDAAIRFASNGAGSHLVQGNYIGFNLDGTVWTGAEKYKYGIYLQDSGSNEISYNYIGGNQLYALFMTGAGSNGNHVVENSIGVAPTGAAAGNGAGSGCLICFAVSAVDLAGGAHDNYIGAIGGSGGHNIIANNFGGGVYVEPAAGTGNRVYGNNQIHDNGGSLAIDLGSVGPTLNDVGDGDSGGNNLQNYPVLSQAMRIEAGVVRVSGSLVTQTGVAAQTYRLDVYWTDSCLFSGGGSDTPRGEMKRYVGALGLYSDGTPFLVPFSNTDIVASNGIPHPTAANPGYLFAIATDAAGNTSEPGPCRTFVDDYIFSNGFN